MLKRLLRGERAQAVAARLLGLYLALTYRTIRWRLEGRDIIEGFVSTATPLVFVFWHERLPMIPVLWRLVRGALPQGADYAPRFLVSRHRDGRLISSVVARFGATPVFGSSSRGGAAALRGMIEAVNAGHPVLITPDGPRGPRRVAAPGAAQLAAMTGCRLVAGSAAVSRAVVLSSWDRMMIPLPFGRGVVVIGDVIDVPPDGAAAAIEHMSAAMSEACERADAAVGR